MVMWQSCDPLCVGAASGDEGECGEEDGADG